MFKRTCTLFFMFDLSLFIFPEPKIPRTKVVDLICLWSINCRWASQDNKTRDFGLGFLQFLGEIDYGCQGRLCQTAHSEGDTGGEWGTQLEWMGL